MALVTRLCRSGIPWIYHVVSLTLLAVLPSWRTTPCISTYIILTLLCDTESFLAAIQSPSSPPIIPHPYLPFLGHVFGIFFYGASYFALVNQKTRYPIFTLLTLTGRTVAVADPYLAGGIQRESPNRSFYAAILEVTRRIVSFDDQSMAIITWNLHSDVMKSDGSGQEEEDGLMHEAGRMVAHELSPGASLNELSSMQLERFSIEMGNLIPKNEQEVTIGLMDMVKKVFTVANAYTIYGPQNIFTTHPTLIDKFWDYEAGIIGVLIDFLPQITAKKAWRAQRDINAALHDYIEEEHYTTASPMIQKRVAINLKHGLSKKMAGRGELIMLFGILGNAVPTSFWVLANILSRPVLLEGIRDETQAAISYSTTELGSSENTLSVSKLKKHCPVLVSTYRESLRLIANLASVRQVMDTHTISVPGYPAYKLTKGDMVQICGGVVHQNTATWGQNASSFHPRGFIPQDQTVENRKAKEEKEKHPRTLAERTLTSLPPGIPSAAYRAFGGGAVICPGRHFAANEILGFVALCVNMFDITAMDGGAVQCPERDDAKIPLTVMKPVTEPRVRVRRRIGRGDAEGIVWKLEL